MMEISGGGGGGRGSGGGGRRGTLNELAISSSSSKRAHKAGDMGKRTMQRKLNRRIHAE